ncbi:MAG TPA: ATP-binding protein [Bryobacteraceae bacterium]|jgi:two-component system sensor histidine kinase CpxA|nr:ATP-binding protein [Bryobacteraceae bacterium]
MRWQRSLSAKIFITAFLNLVLLIVVFLVFARVQYRFDLSSFLLAPARDRILSVSRLIALNLEETSPASWDQVLQQYASKYEAQLFLFDDSGNQYGGAKVTLPPQVAAGTRHDPFGSRRQQGASSQPVPRPLGDGPIFLITAGRPSEYWVGTDIPIWAVRSNRPIHGFLIWRFRTLWTNTFFFNYKAWATVILATILVSVICWLPLIRGLTHFISELTHATRRVAEGHFDIKLPVRRQDELGQLSTSIHQMTERLANFVHGQRRFLSDVAHELSSPVARMQAALGILEQRVQEGPQSYVSDALEELQHMSELINELLLFSKAQIGGSKIDLKPVNVADTVRRAVEREASPESLIEMQVGEQLEVVANPEYLFRSLANVIRNAIRYAGNFGPITISAKNGNSEVAIMVTDNGPGLPESELDKVFKPFYRPEFARQRETGGVGLGLAIVRNCVEACDGSVRCRNRSPRGLEVEIRLPAA